MATSILRKSAPSPLLIPVSCWLIGILLGKILAPPALILVFMAAGLFLIALPCKTCRVEMILLLFVTLGALRLQSSFDAPSFLQKALQDRTHIQQDAVFHLEQRLSDRALSARLDSLAGFATKEKILIFGTWDLQIGDSYTALVELLPLKKDPLLDMYPNRYVASARLLLPPTPIPERDNGLSFAKFRVAMLSHLDQLLGDKASVAKALLFSDTEAKKEQRDYLSRAGITHLVVVSGLHVVFISLVLLTFFRMWLPVRIAEAIFLISICLFAAMNNWAAPITRAILMIALAIFARWLSRPLSMLQNMAISIWIITMVQPEQLYNLGLQLSYLSVLLIVVAVPSLQIPKTASWLKRKGITLLNLMFLSLIVGVGLMPFTLYHFGSVSLNGIVGNLLGIPIIAMLLPLSALILLWPDPRFILSYQFLIQAWDWWLQLSASLPFQKQGWWLSLSEAVALGLFIFLLFMAVKRKWHTLKFAAPIAFVAIGILLVWPIDTSNKIYLFNSGVSDCSLITTKNGETIMIDTGGLKGFASEKMIASFQDSWLESKLLPYLARKKISQIDYLIVTHLHADHAGGMMSILSNCKVKNLLLTDESLNSSTWKQLSPHLALQNVKIIPVTDTISYHFGEQTLKILHPDKNFQDSNINNQSIVCSFSSPQEKFLFTGDIEAEAEEYLVKNYGKYLKADYLKVPHHGSKSSSSPEFLRAISPKEAWISTTRKNVYGFPHPQTMEKLAKYTDRIRFTYEGSIEKSTK